MNEPVPSRIRVVLADDHTLFREGLRELLAVAPGIRVVAEASTGDEAVDLIRQSQPDVLLLDVEMPGPGAAETLRQIRRASPRTRVVVLSMHDEPALMRQLLLDGAAAYLTKVVPSDDLVATVRSVCRDSPTVLLSLSRRALGQLGDSSGPQVAQRRGPAAGPGLTPRESEILRLVSEGMSNAQIAARLRVTQATVKRHLTNIYAKLHAVSRTDAVRKATSAGVIEDRVEQGRGKGETSTYRRQQNTSI